MDRSRTGTNYYQNGALHEDQSFVFSNNLNVIGNARGIGTGIIGGGELGEFNQIPGAAVSADDNTCVLCFKNVEIYSIGECDHPVCHECSTRMRVLCQQNECPICRQALPKVIFSEQKLSFRELESKNRSECYNKKYKIGFCSERIQDKFYELLDHPCPKCNIAPYRTFQGLRSHVRKMHNMVYCDLCVVHLNIFTFERRCYTQAELSIHLTKGDVDNRSHRGHPLCEYCNKRFLDRDELFRHLRREHYFCHFCDADGCNEFYRDYDDLAEHFRQQHFLCEEGKCATEKFTGAFRSEIDFKAHVANVHGNLLNKQQAKQTRTLQLEITLGPRNRSGNRSNDNLAQIHESYESDHNETAGTSGSYPQRGARTTEINASNEQEFPALKSRDSNQPTNPLSLTRPPPLSLMNRSRMSGLARTQENFPSLNGMSKINDTQKSYGGSNSSTFTSDNSGQQLLWSSLSKSTSSQMGSSNGATSSSKTVTTPTRNGVMLLSTNNKKPLGAITTASAIQKSISGNSSNSSSVNVNYSSNTGKKNADQEFPALPATKSSKKLMQPISSFSAVSVQPISIPSSRGKPISIKVHDEDFIQSTPRPQFNVALQSKHRNLVDDYVSDVDPITLQKIQLIKLDETNTNKPPEKRSVVAPKLNEMEFPSLSGNNTNSNNNNIKTIGGVSGTWIKPLFTKNAAENKTKGSVNSKVKQHKEVLLQSNSNKNNNNYNCNSKEKKIKETINNNENKKNNNTKKVAEIVEKNNKNQVDKTQKGKNTSENGIQHSNVTLNSVAKSPNNFTFTTSMGESFNILPSIHNYTPPPEAFERNMQLVKDFRDIFGNAQALEEFRAISQSFREGVYKSQAYYEHCRCALSDKFQKIFPELICLLPDINKQQELYLAYQQNLNELNGDQQKSIKISLNVCSVCKQVLIPRDIEKHYEMHQFCDNFPVLNDRQRKTFSTKNNNKNT